MWWRSQLFTRNLIVIGSVLSWICFLRDSHWNTALSIKLVLGGPPGKQCACLYCVRILRLADHRIIGWERLLRSSVPTICPTPSCLLNHISQSATSTHFLNTYRDGDSTASLGSLFQCLTTLSVKKFFLISSLNLPWCSLRSLPLILLLVTWEKRPTPASLQPSFR